MPPEIDEHTIELIANRVTASLREELEAIVAGLVVANGWPRPLTVEEVADRFGVARSTVYAHWREWGGYKLGGRHNSSIRFDQDALPVPPTPSDTPNPATTRRRDLLRDNPDSEHLLDIGR